jgi:hypothetical protein
MSRRDRSERSDHDSRAARITKISSLVATAALALCVTGCPSVATTQGARPPAADKWYQRAKADYGSADVGEARDSIKKALAIVPNDPAVRTLAARIALAGLDYAEALRLLKGIKGSDAAGLRGRALWYNGELEAAADELDSMLNDPEIVDDWAKGVSKLARRGAGRTPFALSGALLAAVELTHVNPVAPFFVVPVEIDGESALALIATGNAEVYLDSSTRPEPAWVSMRFGQKLEVHDVPALTQDLSGFTKQVGAPIKALIGVNLLRHLHTTMDYDGHQFVVRTFSPPPPPDATRVDLSYIRGGGMILRGKFGGERGEPVSLLLDTSMTFPLALDEGGWKKAGSVAKDLKLIPQDPEQKLREGLVPMVRLGAFDVPKVPGVYGTPVDKIEKQIGLDIDGLIGTSLLAPFRVTFADQGRMMWIEDTTILLQRMLSESARGQGPDEPPPDFGPGGLPDPVSPFGPPPGPGPGPSLKLPPAPGGGNPAPPPSPSPGANSPPGGAKPQRKAPER